MAMCSVGYRPKHFHTLLFEFPGDHGSPRDGRPDDPLASYFQSIRPQPQTSCHHMSRPGAVVHFAPTQHPCSDPQQSEIREDHTDQQKR